MSPDFDAIKRTTDIVAVVASYGVELKRSGADHVGLCPFHEDHRPSLHVTQGKGLFHCPACGAAGNVIQFVAKKEGIPDREAALKILGGLPNVARGSALPVVAAAVPPLPPADLFTAAIEHYHADLFSRDTRGLDYLKKRGLDDVETLQHFKVGFVAGSLKARLTAAQRGTLAALFNEKGNERFYLRVVVPIFDAAGMPVGLYGRSIQPDNTAPHLYLPGEHRAVWNGAAAVAHADELIVTEAILDGLAIFAAKKRNVIAAYGAGGWRTCHDELMKKHSVRKLVLAFDGDKRGTEAAEALAAQLVPRGIRCHRIQWPEGVKDACDYLLSHDRPAFLALAAAALRIGPNLPETLEAAAPRLTLVEHGEAGAQFQNGTLNYRVRAISGNGLRVVVTARNEKGSHVDNIDLYGARSRRTFATSAADRLEIETEKIEEDLLALVSQWEALQSGETLAAEVPPVEAMSEADRAEALALLHAPDLLARVAADLELIGYVGESRNKQLAYLIGTSRRLPKPLSAIFRAQSGSGKSFLMECVAELMPPEDVHYFSRLTPQALYYIEPDALAHRLLIVDERDGSEESEYPIRTLQTRRQLKLAVPVKDPNSGKIKTLVLTINGPIAYMESTADQRINPENANRCFELYLDESEEQTKAIFTAQRRARTLEGWGDERRKAAVVRAHHNAQRLLQSFKVIIPFVELIEFPAAWLRGRRDNDRFLSLIEGIAFLHQCQRQRSAAPDDAAIEYIEATADDYAAAYDLAHVVFAQAGSDVPKPTADFLAQVEAWAQRTADETGQKLEELTFTRRQVREAVRLPDHLIKRHMREIEDLEYIEVRRAQQGGSFRYRLLPQKKAPPVLDGLTTPDALAQKWNKWVKSGNRPKPPAEAHKH